MKFIKIICLLLLLTACGQADSITIRTRQMNPRENNTVTPYTIMIYMNGSDLESDFGAATTDLLEILESGLDSKNANVIILTGGTKRWQNDVVPADQCMVWKAADGYLIELDAWGGRNMGEPCTLADFILFSQKNYPAQQYGLIMWDHGGGSIAGFGHDEKFDDSLTLLDMVWAFETAGLREEKLSFLGFDACLMATVEMAVLAADYAHVLIASEDLEPGDGWDYVFLSALNDNPQISGAELGVVIVDTFMDFYGVDSDEILSLSVVDLAKVTPVMDTMGHLMALGSAHLDADGFRTLARRRATTKTFGEGSPRDNYADMVDIGDMAVQLADLFPREAARVLDALNACVLYNRHNSDVELYGLSTFYIYGGKSQGVASLRTYEALGANEAYTAYLHQFFEGLLTRRSGEFISNERVLWQPVDSGTFRMAGLAASGDGSWPRLGGYFVSLFPITQTAAARQYAIPARINEREADIIVSISARHPQGKIMGARHRDGNVLQKGYDPIEVGDRISLYALEWTREVHLANENAMNWHETEVFTVDAPLHLDWQPAMEDAKMGQRITEIGHNVIYTVPR